MKLTLFVCLAFSTSSSYFAYDISRGVVKGRRTNEIASNITGIYNPSSTQLTTHS